MEVLRGAQPLRRRVQGRQGGWYVKVTVGRDALTGRRTQITRRGFATAAEAAKARRDLLAMADRGQLRPAPSGLTLNELLDLYLDGLDAVISTTTAMLWELILTTGLVSTILGTASGAQNSALLPPWVWPVTSPSPACGDRL